MNILIIKSFKYQGENGKDVFTTNNFKLKDGYISKEDIYKEASNIIDIISSSDSTCLYKTVTQVY